MTVGGYLFNAAAILVITTTIVLLILTRFGWRLDTVLSGSMEPNVRKGSLVLTEPVEAAAIRVGDVIVFRHAVAGEQPEQILIVHRVIGAGDGTWLRTKGDANEKPDAFVVSSEDVVGRVCLKVPYVGCGLQLARTPFGIAALACCIGMLIVADVALMRQSKSADEKESVDEKGERDDSPRSASCLATETSSMGTGGAGTSADGVADVSLKGKRVATARHRLRFGPIADDVHAGQSGTQVPTLTCLIDGDIEILYCETSLYSDTLYTLHLEGEPCGDCNFYSKPIDLVGGRYHIEGTWTGYRSAHRNIEN